MKTKKLMEGPSLSVTGVFYGGYSLFGDHALLRISGSKHFSILIERYIQPKRRTMYIHFSKDRVKNVLTLYTPSHDTRVLSLVSR
jgi:hypothetical protein